MSVMNFQQLTRVMGAVLFIALTQVFSGNSAAQAATLPSGAKGVFDTVSGLDLPVLPDALSGLADKFEKISDTHYEIADTDIGEVKGRLAIYKPSGKDWLFAAMFSGVSLSNLGLVDGGVLDQAALSHLVIMHVGEDLGDAVSIGSWGADLGAKLKNIAKDASNKLPVKEGLNVYARLDAGASGDAADLLSAVGADVAEITLYAHQASEKTTKTTKTKGKSVKKSVKTKTIELRAHHFASWSKPFGLSDTKLKKTTMLFSKDAKQNKTVQAWGEFTLKGKNYFLWAGQTKGPSIVGRGFGLGAKEIAMSVILDFVDTMPAFKDLKFGKAIKDKLPIQDIKVINSQYKKPAAGEFPAPETFTFVSADPGVAIATTGLKGPIMGAGGKVKFMKWDGASLKMFMDPKKGTYSASGKFTSPKLAPLPMTNARFFVDVNKSKNRYEMGAKGKVKFEGVTLSGVKFNVSKSEFKMVLDLGCVPPMLKGTLKASYCKTNIPKLKKAKVKASGCGKKVANAIKDAAKAAGHTLKNGIKKVGSAIKDLANSIAGEENEKQNKDVPLFRTASKHMMLTEILNDWPEDQKKVDMTSIVFEEYNIPFTIDIKVWATKKQLKDAKKDIECQARGRMSALLKMKNSVPDFIAVVSEAIDAEIKFYDPFEDYKKEIRKLIKKKDWLDPKYIELLVCENAKA